MRSLTVVLVKFFVVIFTLFTVSALAQEPAPAPASEAPALNAKTPVEKKVEVDSKKQPAKKMVQDASITLQTTITGNQEQPRVLYILPWQSPTATDVDFESLDNEQKAVFGHVEREELRRELESSDVIQ
jgi:hypothetical protein